MNGISPAEILTGITLAVSGWTLVKVVALGEAVAVLKNRIDTCQDCHHPKFDEK
jgi:hypothetical protein